MKIVFTALALLCSFFCTAINKHKTPAAPKVSFFFDAPAQDWMRECLPIGNGKQASMIYGGIATDTIQLNEESMWKGGPGTHPEHNFGMRPGAADRLPHVRQLISEGKRDEAFQIMQQHMTGVWRGDKGNTDFGANQPLGNIIVRTKHSDITDYTRTLSMNEGLVNVKYKTGRRLHERTYFSSYPQGVQVYHYTSAFKDDVQIDFSQAHHIDSSSFANNILTWHGRILHNGMHFAWGCGFVTDGEVSYNEKSINVRNFSQLTIIQSAQTDYAQSFPTYRKKHYPRELEAGIQAVMKMGYRKLKKTHIQDFSTLFNRVSLVINPGAAQSNIAIDKRLKDYASGKPDYDLEALYFHYARYLLISSSRPGSLPAHLQGKWNNSTTPPWTCDYHTNINLQMNYWPAHRLNLQETTAPLHVFLQNLILPGRLAAKTFFNYRGWTCSVMTNPFGFTATGKSLPWGYFPAAGAWLSRHLWEHFEYTDDTVFLQQTAFPIMKESAEFWMDYLSEDQNGFLCSSPSFSPEHGSVSGGTTMDHQIARDIFQNTLRAAQLLMPGAKWTDTLSRYLEKIYPHKIGRWGQLQEWKEDIDDSTSRHRHVSHLYGLFPADQISPTHTPQLAKAAEISLKARGDEGTGWSLAWKVSFYARLHNAAKAYQLYQKMLQPVNAGDINYLNGGGVYPNMLCAHPPFQIDGNMGGATGMYEMLMHSKVGELELLPALPDAWHTGRVTGLKAKGNIQVDISWENGRVSQLKLLSESANQTLTIVYRNQHYKVLLQKNKALTITDFTSLSHFIPENKTF